MHPLFLHSGHSIHTRYSIGSITRVAVSTSGRRCTLRQDASGDDPRQRWKKSSRYDSPTKAERRAHFRKSLGGTVAVLATFYAALALFIAFIAAFGSS
jgi:hypothetical protein